MKNICGIFVLLCTVLVGARTLHARDACTWSINYANFVGTCDWYVDGKIYHTPTDNNYGQDGWNLQFYGISDPYAYEWYSGNVSGDKYGMVMSYQSNYNDTIVNAALHSANGLPGDILCLKNTADSLGYNWSGNCGGTAEHPIGCGHVAYVINATTWNGYNAWVVRDANWSGFGQTPVTDESPCGVTIREATFVEYQTGWVKLLNGTTLGNIGYPLAGFIYMSH